MNDPKSTLQIFEDLLKGRETIVLKLRLYVGGTKPKSNLALRTIKEFCESRLKGRYELEVVDVFQQPEMAREDDIVAVPTLIRREPPPVRKLIGDLSDQARVLKGLGLIDVKEEP